MGLPSGVQWANCNIGAERPSDSGLYFSWGNVEGHAEGEGYDFSQSVYDTTPGGAIDSDLSLNQDAARAILGEPWRMPTSDEFQELYDNCTHVWTTMNGVNGILFTSNANGNTVFFPAAGGYVGTSLNSRGTYGDYWSSTYQSATAAIYMQCSSSEINPQKANTRRLGFCVRAVIKPS